MKHLLWTKSYIGTKKLILHIKFHDATWIPANSQRFKMTVNKNGDDVVRWNDHFNQGLIV